MISLLVNVFLFIASLIIVVKSADYCTHYATQLARVFRLSEFVVSFYVVALISALPEASISIFSALDGVPTLGMGTLLGSNIADLTLVFGITALLSAKGVHVKSEILRKDFLYLVLLLLPIILGLNGNYSQVDGLVMVLGGSLFYFSLSRESRMFHKKWNHLRNFSTIKIVSALVFFMALLIFGADYTVRFGMRFAEDVGIPEALVGLTMISIGTCLPELIFSIKAVRNNHDSLALGDVLGTVITDATIVLGLVAIIRPFSFPPTLIYVTGLAMFFSGILAITFITSGKILTKKEGVYLLFFYILYLIAEFTANKVF